MNTYLYLALAAVVGIVAATIMQGLFRFCTLLVRARSGSDRSAAIGGMILCAILVVLFYGTTGGTLAKLLPGQPSGETAFWGGATLGATVFGISRLFAVNYNYSSLNSLTFSCAVFVTVSLSMIFLGQTPLSASNPLESLGISIHSFVEVLALACVAVAIPEGAILALGYWQAGPRTMSLAAIRFQIESNERYSCWHGESESVESMNEALLLAAQSAGAKGKPFILRWLAFETFPRMLLMIDAATQMYRSAAEKAGHIPKDEVSVIARSCDSCRAALQDRRHWRRGLVGRVGARMLIVNNDLAYFAVKIPGRELVGFPDTVVRVDQPDRVALYQVVFRRLWQMREHLD